MRVWEVMSGIFLVADRFRPGLRDFLLADLDGIGGSSYWTGCFGCFVAVDRFRICTSPSIDCIRTAKYRLITSSPQASFPLSLICHLLSVITYQPSQINTCILRSSLQPHFSPSHLISAQKHGSHLRLRLSARQNGK